MNSFNMLKKVFTLLFFTLFLYPSLLKAQIDCIPRGTFSNLGSASSYGDGTIENPYDCPLVIGFCFELESFIEVHTNKVHGIYIDFDDLPEGAEVTEASGSQLTQDNNYHWIWISADIATTLDLPGPGFYVEEIDGAGNPLEIYPTNNIGDGGNGDDPETYPDLAPFCFTLNIDCTSPNVWQTLISISSDKETGSNIYGSSKCPSSFTLSAHWDDIYYGCNTSQDFEVSVPNDITVDCDDIVPAFEALLIENDYLITIRDSSELINGNSDDNEYDIIRTWEVTDFCYQTASYQQTISIRDTEFPVVGYCPEDFSISEAEFELTGVQYTAPVFTDNCSNVTVKSNHSPGWLFDLGVNQVVYTGFDDAGLATTCIFYVTIIPGDSLNCTETIYATANEDGESIVSWNIPAYFPQNCSLCDQPDSLACYEYELMSGIASGGTFPVGTTLNSYIVTDDCGNTDECEVEVVVDAEQVPYCNIKGIEKDDNHRWINQVIFSNISNVTHDDSGYGDYLYKKATVEIGQTYDIYLFPRYYIQPVTVYWRVWIDFNKDGDFYDENETVLETTSSGSMMEQINIPADLEVNFKNTRMRIGLGRYAFPEPCGSFFSGEIEDYSLKIIENETQELVQESETDIFIFPNPTKQSKLNVSLSNFENQSFSLLVTDRLGTPVIKKKYNSIASLQLDISSLRQGVYQLHIYRAKELPLNKMFTIVR